MRKDRKQWRGLVCVIGPALARRAPQLQVITKPCTGEECQQRKSMICRCQDQQNAYPKREPSEGFVKRWGNEDEHQSQEGSEGEPVENFENGVQSLPTLARQQMRVDNPILL